MTRDKDCIFCKILNEEIKTRTPIYADEHSFVFLSNAPVSHGHALVIPQDHFENMLEIPDDYLAQMAPVIKKTAQAVKDATGATGVNVSINNGHSAGQVVLHAHFHVIPRFNGDGFKHWDGKSYSGDQDVEIAEKIKSAIEKTA